MGKNPYGTRPSLTDRYWAWVFRRTERRPVAGIDVGLLWPSIPERDLVLRKVAAALALIDQYDPRRAARLRRCVEGILVFGDTGPVGQWIRGPRLVMLSVTYALRDDITASHVASTLVHESTHAWLEALGFKYDVERWARIEATCFRAEQAFARKLPDPGDLIKRAERQLARDPSYWTAHAARERELRTLRELGVPSWLVWVLGRALPRRAA